LDYQVADSVVLTGGIRYTHDKKRGQEDFRIICMGCAVGITPDQLGSRTPVLDITPTLVSYVPAEGVASPITFDTATGIATRQLSNSWDAVTGTLAAEWKPSDDQLAFVRYSRGYKSGGFNAGGISARPQTNAEYVNAYEAGYKHKVSNRLRANLALYFYDYKDLQVPITVPLADGAPDLTYFYNLKKSKSYGAEIELAWQPTNSLQLMLNYAFSETRVDKAGCITDGEDKTAQQPLAKPCGLPVGAQQPQSIVGSDLPNVPRHKIAANAQYNIQTGSGIFTLSGSYMWRDSAYASIFNRPYNKMPSYDQVDLRGIWTPSNGSYRIIAYAKNLFNTLGYDGASGDFLSYPAVPTLQPQVAQTYSYTPPRTFGLQLDVMFR
jgi:iron complex outermembrane receptor protein